MCATLLTDTQNLFRYSVTKLKSYVVQRKNTVYKIYVQLQTTHVPSRIEMSEQKICLFFIAALNCTFLLAFDRHQTYNISL